MKADRTKRVMYFALMLATTGALSLVLAPSVQAQQPNPIDVFNAERARQRAENEVRRALEDIRQNTRKPVPDQRQRLALLAQIKEDFNLIQVLNNEMIRAAFTARTLDYDSLSDKAADLKKRASRLKNSIKFYDEKDEVKDERKSLKSSDTVDDKQLKTSLIALRQLIGGFVTNPVFQNPGVLNIPSSAKANRDLQDIIELSDSIRKAARKLDKALRQLPSSP
jgi:hypothetical protein